MGGCNCCTFGPLHVLAVCLVISATVLTIGATFWCKFLTVSSGQPGDGETSVGNHTGLGLWTIEPHDNDNTCIFWPNDTDFDTYMFVARILSMVASGSALLFLVLILVPCCNGKIAGARYMKVLSYGFMLVMILCVLCLISLMSDVCKDPLYCELDHAGYACIAAAGIWFLASMAANRLVPKTKKETDTVDENDNKSEVVVDAPTAESHQWSSDDQVDDTGTRNNSPPWANYNP